MTLTGIFFFAAFPIGAMDRQKSAAFKNAFISEREESAKKARTEASREDTAARVTAQNCSKHHIGSMRVKSNIWGKGRQ